ncbi:MAG: hypothetical protein HOM55_09220, partial [Proteobacteria bacterium]|nr:hypothetical protein [Pseudomonadota bacterium]
MDGNIRSLSENRTTILQISEKSDTNPHFLALASILRDAAPTRFEFGLFMNSVNYPKILLSIFLRLVLSCSILVCSSLLAAESNAAHVNTAADATTTAVFAAALDHSINLNEDVQWVQGQGAAPVYTPAYLSPSTYSEGWDFVFGFADGTVVSAQIVVSNFGRGKHRMLVLVKLTDPDGHDMTLKNGRDRVDWFKHQGEFDYEIAKHHFWKQGNTFYFRFSHPTGDIDLTAVSVTEPWDLGIVWSSGKGYQYANIFAPRI